MKPTKRALRTAGSLALGLLLAVGGVASAAHAAPSKPIRFDRLGLEQGLSQATVLCIFQDSRGYVWLGTEDGLNRFDGFVFKTYKHDAADEASLPSSFVWAIDEDAAGNLWLGTDGGGLAMWERATDRFVRHAEVSSRYIRSLRFGADGALWVGTRDSGLHRLDVATGEVTRFLHDDTDASSLSDDHVFALSLDNKGRLWVGTDAGLNRFDAERERFVRFVHEPANPASLSDGRVRALFEDEAGRLWVGTYGGGLNLLDEATGSFTQFRHDADDPASLAHDRVRAVFQDDAGRLWVGTSAGLDLFDPARGGFAHYGADRGSLHSLADAHVMSIAQDRGGVLWVGTRMGGVHKWNPLSWQFGHVAPEPDDPAGLSDGLVMSFSVDAAGRLWVATFGGGLNVMNRVTGEMSRYRHRPGDPGSLSSDRVTALRHDHRGVLWVGTLDGGLNRFDPASGAFRGFRHDPERGDSLGADGVMALLEDRDGVLWVGTFGGGLNRFEPAREGFTHFRHDADDPASLSSDRVTSLVETGDGRLWVGTDGGGLNRFEPRTGRFERFEHDPEDPTSLVSNVVYALHVDPAGGLWAGTRAGLSHLAPGADGFRGFSTRDGLPNNVIYAVQSDHQGRLWLSTNNGLSCFDPRTGEAQNYAVSQGLQSNEFNFGSSYRSASGELFFGGNNGFNAFFPDRLKQNDAAPAVVLTALRKGYEAIEAPADQVDRVELGFRDEVLSFEFAALDFTAPRHNRFAYRLEGFDPDWVEAGHVRRATYTNLDPGRYVFHVRAANSDGVWNEQGVSVEITVAPPPWKSSWAYGSYSLMVIGTVFGFVTAQRRKVQREAEYSRVLEQQVRERTRELARRKVELEQANKQLVQASITDSLTGLANRRFLFEYVEKEVQLLQRRYGRLDEGGLTQESLDLAFMMIDLDNFKTINDTAGHAAGDAVLKQLRDLLVTACRSSDIVIRWGGDEFLVVARDLGGERLNDLAERIRKTIGQHAFDVGDGRVVRTTCSIGFAGYPFLHSQIDALSWEQVMGVADRALYVAKASGRNAWVGFASTETTPEDGLLSAVRNRPDTMMEEGILNVSASFDVNEIEWVQEN